MSSGRPRNPVPAQALPPSLLLRLQLCQLRPSPEIQPPPHRCPPTLRPLGPSGRSCAGGPSAESSRGSLVSAGLALCPLNLDGTLAAAAAAGASALRLRGIRLPGGRGASLAPRPVQFLRSGRRQLGRALSPGWAAAGVQKGYPLLGAPSPHPTPCLRSVWRPQVLSRARVRALWGGRGGGCAGKCCVPRLRAQPARHTVLGLRPPSCSPWRLEVLTPRRSAEHGTGDTGPGAGPVFLAPTQSALGSDLRRGSAGLQVLTGFRNALQSWPCRISPELPPRLYLLAPSLNLGLWPPFLPL